MLLVCVDITTARYNHLHEGLIDGMLYTKMVHGSSIMKLDHVIKML